MVAADATSITQEDVDRARDAGLSDQDVFDIVLAASLRAFFTKTLDALGVEPDASYRELAPELQETLVVGRPIATA
jgi:alkylhydroperoxidase family enzyme